METNLQSSILNDKFYIESAEKLLHELNQDQKTLLKGINLLLEKGFLDDMTRKVLLTVNDAIANKWGEESTNKILQLLFIEKRQIQERIVILSHHKILHDYSIKDFENIQTLIKKHSFTKYKKTINFGQKTCEDCGNDLDLQFRPSPFCPSFLNLTPLEKCMCNSRLPLKKCSECFFKIISKNISEENDSVQDLSQISCLTQCLECGRKICVFEIISVFPEGTTEGIDSSNPQLPNSQEKRKIKDSFTQLKKPKLEPRRCSKCKQPGHLITTCKGIDSSSVVEITPPSENDFREGVSGNTPIEFISPLAEKHPRKNFENQVTVDEDEETLKKVMNYLNGQPKV